MGSRSDSEYSEPSKSANTRANSDKHKGHSAFRKRSHSPSSYSKCVLILGYLIKCTDMSSFTNPHSLPRSQQNQIVEKYNKKIDKDAGFRGWGGLSFLSLLQTRDPVKLITHWQN